MSNNIPQRLIDARDKALKLYKEYLDASLDAALEDSLDDAPDARTKAAYEAWQIANEAFTYALEHPDNDDGVDPKKAVEAELDELLRKAKGL